MMRNPSSARHYQKLMVAAVVCSALLVDVVSTIVVSAALVSDAEASVGEVPAAVGSHAVALAAAQVRRGQQEAFRAAVFVDGQPAPEATASVDIVITRWTTSEARNDLLAALTVKGEQQMRAHLSRQRPTGYVQLATGPRYELKYAWQEPEGRLNRIVLISDRIIPFVTAWNSTRAFRYRLTSFELRVDEEGSGTGAAQVGVRVHVPPETRMLMVETLDAEPVELKDVTRVQ
jgi:hypothetical protein